MSDKGHTEKVLEGNEDKFIGQWRKGDTCYKW